MNSDVAHADLDHLGGNAALRALAPKALFFCHVLDRLQIESIDRMIEERYGEFAAERRDGPIAWAWSG